MKRGLPFAILVLLSSIIVLTFYHKVIFFPNDYMFSDSGDGMKNYFTYYYHIKHDTSFIQFEGMNYPYGEHFLFTDCHPLLANTLKGLGKVDPWFVNYSIGIVNFLMILSVFITFLLMYWILITFRINRWFAVLMALGIGMLAPQVFRMEGHLALSYSAAIPITWALLILSRKYIPDRIFLLMLLINNLIWLFIHAYLGMILIAFQFAFLLSLLVIHRKFREELYRYIAMAATIVIPVVFFYFFASITDNHTGRTNNPSGFFLYNAELDDVFLPHHPPLRPLLDMLSAGAIKLQWEAWSYVGMTTTLVFLLVVIVLIKRIFTRKTGGNITAFFEYRLLNVSLISATIVLLFAMAIPFKQFPQLLDAFPIFKQFRATGRFTWVFFFVGTVFGATIMQKIYRSLRKKNKGKAGMIIAALGALFMISEGFAYHQSISASIIRSPNLFRLEMLSGPFQNALDKFDPAGYQAILPLPFFYQGSESFARPGQDETVRASMVVAAYTGLPLLGTNLTRTSIRESKNIVQLVTPNFYEKPIQVDLVDDRPFLIVRTGDAISGYENLIFNKCDTIYQNKSISIYSVSKEQLFNTHSESIIETLKSGKTYSAFDEFLITDSLSFIYYKSFEENEAEHTFRGNGAFQSVKRGKNVLAEFPPGTFDKDKEYHSGIWMYNGYQDALNLWFRYIIEEYDEEKNAWYETIYFPEQAEVIYGNWSLIEGHFQVHDPKNWVYIVTRGKDDSKAQFIADDLFIREKGVDVYRWGDDSTTLFYNNHHLEIFSQP